MIVAQARWPIGEPGNAPLGTEGHETVEIDKHPGTELVLHGTVLGAPVTLAAEDVHCAAGATCTIDGSNFGTNHSNGKLEFTEVKVDPSTCSVPGGKLVTEELTDEVIMDLVEGSTVVFDKLFPQNIGNVWFELAFEGAECPLAGAVVPVKGTAAGEAVHTTTGSELVPSATGGTAEPAHPALR